MGRRPQTHRRQRQDLQKSKSATHPFSPSASFFFVHFSSSLIYPYSQIVPSASRRCNTPLRHHHRRQSLSLLSTRSETATSFFPFKMVLELLAANTAYVPVDLLVLNVAMASFNGLLAFVAFSQVSSLRNGSRLGDFYCYLDIMILGLFLVV